MQSQKMEGKVQRDQFGPRDHSVCVSYIDCFCFASSSTPLHLAVRSNNMVLIEILLSDSRTDCERQDKEGFVPLWYALQNPVNRRKLRIEKNKQVKGFFGFQEELSIAEQLTVKCPSCVNAVSSVTGAPLLHMAAFAKLEQAT
jgi:hypothetical protein